MIVPGAKVVLAGMEEIDIWRKKHIHKKRLSHRIGKVIPQAVLSEEHLTSVEIIADIF